MQSLYPAFSSKCLAEICSDIQREFSLAPFTLNRRSKHLATAVSHGGILGFEVTEYFEFVTPEEAAAIGPPDYWHLAWRAAIGSEFNYQVMFDRDATAVSRSAARRLKQRLRLLFEHLRLHGDPRSHSLGASE